MGEVAAVTELRFERWYLALAVPIGLGPKNSEVRVADGHPAREDGLGV